MKTGKRFSFIKTTIVGGLIFLVPIIVLTIILGKALGITRTIVVPHKTVIKCIQRLGADSNSLLGGNI